MPPETHALLFSMGKYSCNTIFGMINEIKPTIVYLVYDEEFKKAGDATEKKLDDLISEKKINRMPTLYEILDWLEFGTSVERKTEILQSLTCDDKDKKRKKNLQDLLEATGFNTLTFKDLDSYAVKRAINLIKSCQKIVNEVLGDTPAFTSLKEAFKDKSESDTRELCFVLGIRKDRAIDIIYTLTKKQNLNEGECVLLSRIASTIREVHPQKTVIYDKERGEDKDIIIKKIEGQNISTSVRLAIKEVLVGDFKEKILNKNTRYSFNISAGVTAFSTSLYLMGSWLNADIYITPRTNQVIKLPTPESDNLEKFNEIQKAILKYIATYREDKRDDPTTAKIYNSNEYFLAYQKHALKNKNIDIDEDLRRTFETVLNDEDYLDNCQRLEGELLQVMNDIIKKIKKNNPDCNIKDEINANHLNKLPRLTEVTVKGDVDSQRRKLFKDNKDKMLQYCEVDRAHPHKCRLTEKGEFMALTIRLRS